MSSAMSGLKPLIENALRIIIDRPRTILALFLVLTALAGWQIRNFEIDASPDTLLMKNDAGYIRMQQVEQQFPSPEFMIIAYRPAGGVFTPETFGVLEDLTARIQQLDRVVSTRSLLNVPVVIETDALSQGHELSDTYVEDNDYSMSLLKREFTDHPVYEDLLINEDETAVAIQVLFEHDDALHALDQAILELQVEALQEKGLTAARNEELSRLQRRVEPLRQQLQEQRAGEIRKIRGFIAHYPDSARFYLGGPHVLAYDLIRIIRHDLMVFGAAIAVIICIVLFVLFGRLRWIVAPVLCCACSVILTTGLFAVLGLKTTVISSSFVVLQLILTLAIVIHLIIQYREYHTLEPGLEQRALIDRTLRAKVTPSLYAGLTTSAGFGSLVFSQIQPVITFGWMMISAMAISIAVTLILFPAVLMLFGKGAEGRERAALHAVLRAFAWATRRHPYAMLLLGGALLAASMLGFTRLEVENSFINYFKSSTTVHRELSFIDREFGGSTPLDLVYRIAPAAEDPNLEISAETVRMAYRIQQALERYDASGKVMSLTNFLDLAEKARGGMPLNEHELSVLYWTMPDTVRNDLLDPYYSPESRQLRLNVRIQDTTPGLDRGELLSDIRADMSRLGIPPDRFVLTNLFILYEDVLARLFMSQILTLGIVCGVLAAMFLALFRSLRIAVIAIVPNILAVAVVLGFMGWAGIALDLMTITIASIGMGIAVDDTIHYVHRYLIELRKNPAEKAVQNSLFTVGYAMLYTTVIIVIGFAALSFSDFVPSILFGLLTGMAMVMALIATLSLLPVLLTRFVKADRPRAQRGTSLLHH